MLRNIFDGPDEGLNVSFGYQCSGRKGCSYDSCGEIFLGKSEKIAGIPTRDSSFSCLTGAALSANTTLANTNICNGLIGTTILPSLDSPKTFQRLPPSPSLSSLDILSSSLQSNVSNMSGYLSSHSDGLEWTSTTFKSMSAPSPSEGFLNAVEVDIAGGAAGEDRVQAVCSEENGWLFCAIFDGFNGRDAADFLAGTLYENIVLYLNKLHSQIKSKNGIFPREMVLYAPVRCFPEDSEFHEISSIKRTAQKKADIMQEDDKHFDSPTKSVLQCMETALAQAERDFLHMVELEMNDRPDLVSIGSCVLAILLHGQNMYILGLGDCRALLASTVRDNNGESLVAFQLNDTHSTDNKAECRRILSEHPDDPRIIIAGKVKGKLKLTRAFGIGYLKKKKMNDALMGILQVPNLSSPPYISVQPSLHVHRVSRDDQFVIAASDGLFDFFNNEEAITLVHSFICDFPCGDPARFLVEQLVFRAAKKAGLSLEELMNIPAGWRRKYHDDVTVIVVFLGGNHRTSTASTNQ